MSIPDLATVHAAIADGLSAALPGVAIEQYPAYAKSIPLPCVLFELAGWEHSSDPGTGQLCVVLKFEGRAVVDPALSGSQMAVRELALLLARTVRSQTWGIAVSAASLVGESDEDGFHPDLEGYLVWRVAWSQHVTFGDPVDWQTYALPMGDTGAMIQDYPESLAAMVNGALPVSRLLVGIAPDIGTGKAADYWDTQTIPTE